MADTAIIYDVEFLTLEDSTTRFWCGPYDPDPVIAQIGAVKLDLTGTFEMIDTFRAYVTPPGRGGPPQAIDPFFTRLTGISEAEIAEKGQPLGAALAAFDAFSGGARLWSWGKDEFNMVAISCYVAGLAPPIPIERFGNAAALVLKAGMPYDDVKRTRSNGLAAYFGMEIEGLRAHDGLDDALSVAHALRHLLSDGRLMAADFT
ncbi:MAG: 3'-5' exonuclease [Pseudomonadota bacterium]